MDEPYKASKLETLPDEILIMIWHESRNPSLIFASPYLHDLVNYRGIRSELITSCCRDERLADSTPNAAHDNLRWLMLEKWLCLSWLWNAMWDWLEDYVTAEMELRLAYLERARIIDSGESSLARVGMLDLIRNSKTLRGGMRGMAYQFSTSVVHGDGRSERAVVFGIEISAKFRWIRLKTYGYMHTDNTVFFDKTSEKIAFFVVPIRTYNVFPTMLLEGPWTRSRGNILTFFMGFIVPNMSHGHAKTGKLLSASRGLMRAIQSACLPALAVLGGAAAMILRSQLKIPTDTIAPEHVKLILAEEPDQDDWNTTVIIAAGDSITGFNWNECHVKALLQQAKSTTTNRAIWGTLVHELYDELLSGRRSRMRGKKPMIRMIENYFCTVPEHFPGQFVAWSRWRAATRCLDPKIRTQGFSL